MKEREHCDPPAQLQDEKAFPKIGDIQIKITKKANMQKIQRKPQKERRMENAEITRAVRFIMSRDEP